MRRVPLLGVVLIGCWIALRLSLQQGRYSVEALTARLQTSPSENPEFWHSEGQWLGIEAREKAWGYEA